MENKKLVFLAISFIGSAALQAMEHHKERVEGCWSVRHDRNFQPDLLGQKDRRQETPEDFDFKFSLKTKFRLSDFLVAKQTYTTPELQAEGYASSWLKDLSSLKYEQSKRDKDASGLEIYMTDEQILSLREKLIRKFAEAQNIDPVIVAQEHPITDFFHKVN